MTTTPTRDDSSLFLGIDGGGTSTRAVLVDATGTILGRGTTGASNYHAVGAHDASLEILSAVEAAWSQAGSEMRPCTVAFLGMAGVVSEIDRATIVEIASRLHVADRVDVDHDLRSALAGGLVGAPGIVLIAGTGSACYGHDGENAWRSGGWGHLLDDLGSAYWIALQGAIAITRAADGRAPGTSLSDVLLPRLGIETIDQILHRLHHEIGRSELAALAPVVVDEAASGDRVALAIVERGARELAAMASAVVRALPSLSDAPPIVAIGGMLANTFYRPLVERAIAEMLPKATLVEPILSPDLGAALLAMKHAGIEASEEVVNSLTGNRN